MADNISQRLKAARRMHRLTQQEMAELVGVKRSTYANWEYGIADPPDVAMERLAQYMNEPTPRVVQLNAEPIGRIPVLGKIAAGDGSEIDDDPVQFIDVPIKFARPDFSGAVATGDSNLPFIHPGDVLIFKDTPHPKIGRFMGLRSPRDGGTIVKKVVVEGDSLVLRSLNPKYEDVPIEGFQVLGLLVGLHSATGDLSLGPFIPGIDENYYMDQLGSRLPHHE